MFVTKMNDAYLWYWMLMCITMKEISAMVSVTPTVTKYLLKTGPYAPRFSAVGLGQMCTDELSCSGGVQVMQFFSLVSVC